MMSCAVDARAECRFADSRAAATWAYRFRAESGPDGLVLHVTATFPLGPNGAVALQLPAHWAGETLHGMTNLRAASPGARLEVSTTGESAVLREDPNESATNTYELRKDWTGPFVNPLQFHAVLMPEYFEFTGSNALVFPQLDSRAQMVASTHRAVRFRAASVLVDLGHEFWRRQVRSRSLSGRNGVSR